MYMDLYQLDHLRENGWTELYCSRSLTLRAFAQKTFIQPYFQNIYRLDHCKKLQATDCEHARAGSKSSFRGLNAFPPHTDEAFRPIPPRYIMLRLLSGKSQSATELFEIENSEIDKRLLSDLSCGLWACRGAQAPHISSVCENDRIRWDEDCMRPLDSLAKRAHVEFRMCLLSLAKIRFTWTTSSSVLLIDNWRTLHGRELVPVCERRQIERLYVEMA